jgi:acyl-coenzyme A synthetase/AMP-(fatty) acid ligase
MIFLVDKNIEYSYEDLLIGLNLNSTYYPGSVFPLLFDFLSNLLQALVKNLDITLLDSDFSDSELKQLDISQLTSKKVAFNAVKLKSKEDLIKRVESSKSNITIFTSGTTGLPKRVTHTINSLTRMVRMGDRHSNKTWALAYNPSHIAGVQVILQALLNGNTMVNIYNNSTQQSDLLLDKYQVTHISATPTFYRMLVSSGKVQITVERCTLGGEKSDKIILNKIIEKFPKAKLNNIYASTEFGSIFVSKNDAFSIPEEIKTLIKIKKNQLIIHSSLIADDEFISDEWYSTGDIVEFIDKKNKLFRITGRISEIINIGGYNVNPIEVEESILSLDYIESVRVYGRDNSVMGKVLCADIKSDIQIEVPEIRKILASKLQPFKIPRIIKQVGDISLTRTGKTKRS